MLVDKGQYARLVAAMPRGQLVGIGDIPSAAGKETGPGWVSEMDHFAGKIASVVGIRIHEVVGLADGREMFDVYLTLELNDYSFDFALDWMDDHGIDTALSQPIKSDSVELVSNGKEDSSVGFGWALGGAVAAVIGLAAVSKKKQGKQTVPPVVAAEHKQEVQQPHQMTA